MPADQRLCSEGASGDQKHSSRTGATPRASQLPAGHRGLLRGPRRHTYVRPLAGLATVVVIVAVIALALTQFRGGFTETVPVTVLSDRAGLMMTPAQRSNCTAHRSAPSRPSRNANGQAAIHLAIDPSRMRLLPANVLVDIVATTAFGAKFIQLIPPEDPSPQRLRAGQVLDADPVTVEINTVFQQLTSVLAKIDPAKLNQTLGAIATSLNGRGGRLGQLSQRPECVSRQDRAESAEARAMTSRPPPTCPSLTPTPPPI